MIFYMYEVLFEGVDLITEPILVCYTIWRTAREPIHRAVE
jgi:hypothetical protein